MGWSYSQAAGRTLDAIEAACKASREGTGETAANVFFARGRRYFYQVSRREMNDGGISGTVYLAPPGEGWCRKAGGSASTGGGEWSAAPPCSARRWPCRRAGGPS
jgi:hypothetical protein